jgi:hypothetical protein
VEQKKKLSDPLIDEVRATRERLVREHGGLHGWVAYVRQEQAKHPEKLVSRKSRIVGR